LLVAVVRNGDQSQLVQERVVPDVNALQEPEFTDTQRSVLAEGIAELRIAYFGRDPDAAETEAPTWRERWDDKQHLPLLVARREAGRARRGRRSSSRGARAAGCPAWDAGRRICARAG
jgi:hypothetical protein